MHASCCCIVITNMCLYFSTADVDYDNLTALIVTFNIGEISRVISVTITDDGVAEDDESFEVFLKPIPDTTDVIIGEPSVAVGIIVDNDTTSKEFNEHHTICTPFDQSRTFMFVCKIVLLHIARVIIYFSCPVSK